MAILDLTLVCQEPLDERGNKSWGTIKMFRPEGGTVVTAPAGCFGRPNLGREVFEVEKLLEQRL